MAEFEFAGMTFRGGKMMIVLTALSTLAGGAWAGFEFYKDYMDMREVVQNIDVDAIAAENAKVILKMDEQMTRIEEAIEYTRDIKNDLKDDIIRIEQINDSTSKRVKDIQDSIDKSLRQIEQVTRDMEKDIRDTMRTTDKDLRDDMRQLDTDLNIKLQEALDNPLNDMK